jgi:hypothetical protein
MTTFGKVLIALMLVTAGVLVVKGYVKPDEDLALTPTVEETTTTTTPSEMEVSTASSTEAFSGSIKDLKDRGGDYKCVFDQNISGSQTSGTAFISGNKLRLDSKSVTQILSGSMNIESHVISDGTLIYVWSSMMPTGIKMSVPDENATTSIETTQGFDYDQVLDYQCAPWVVDTTEFDLPATIEFKELS